MLLVPARAYANYAWHYAFATFLPDYWLWYVLVTILFEALVLGRWLRVPGATSLFLSLLANAITALAGYVVANIFPSFPFGVFGSEMNPNPFFDALLLFTLFGIGSGFVEGFIWHIAVAETGSKEPRTRTLGRSVVVHVAVVPIGLAILLIPARPYGDLESAVRQHRTHYPMTSLQDALSAYVVQHGRLPYARDFDDLIRRMQPQMIGFEHSKDLWAIAYEPSYSRFATGDDRRGPKCEWNPAASGLRIGEGDPPNLWITRRRVPGWTEGYSGIIMEHGVIYFMSRASDGVLLGYDPPGRERQTRRKLRAGRTRLRRN
jgi:hypothetical protein